MKTKQTITFFSILIFAFIGWLDASELAIDKQQKTNIGIQVVSPVAVNKSPVFRAPATISVPPSLDFLVSASHEGKIEFIEVSIGESVVKGQLLAQIFSPEYLELQREYLSLLSDYELAATRLKHDEMLVKEGVISKYRALETRSNFNKFNVLINEHKQLLKLSGMDDFDVEILTKRRVLQSHLKLKSPADGVVLNRMVASGQQVEPLAPLFRVASLKKLYVELAVPQERLKDISIGDKIEVDNSDTGGTIILVGQNVDPESQSVLVRAVIDEKNDQLRPGQNISVQLFSKQADLLYKVPTSAVFRSDQTSYLFIETGTGFKAIEVQIKGQDASGIVISGSFKSENKVVSAGVAALKLLWLEQHGGE